MYSTIILRLFPSNSLLGVLLGGRTCELTRTACAAQRHGNSRESETAAVTRVPWSGEVASRRDSRAVVESSRSRASAASSAPVAEISSSYGYSWARIGLLPLISAASALVGAAVEPGL
jgi:hypothetical protein